MQTPKTALSLVDSELTIYCEQCTSDEPPLCKRIREEAQSHQKAHWISGPIVGTILKLLISATKARQVLDVGTFLGYSAVYMASAHPRVQVTSLEKNAQLASGARSFIKDSAYEPRISVETVDVSSWLQAISRPLDVIFFDSNRTELMAIYQSLLDSISPGGMLVMDNACLRRKVLAPSKRWESQTVLFNARIQQEKQFLTTVLPVRDGLLVAHKLPLK